VSFKGLTLSYPTTLQLLRCCSFCFKGLAEFCARLALRALCDSSGQNSTSFPAPVKGFFRFASRSL
jgi:hypothetical protein